MAKSTQSPQPRPPDVRQPPSRSPDVDQQASQPIGASHTEPEPRATPKEEPKAEPTSSPQAIVMKGSPQNTVKLVAGQVCNVDGIATEGGERCGWRLKNMGPADVWVRWDGGDAAVDAVDSIVLDAGEIIPACIGRRLSMVCSAQPGGGARVSFVMAKIN